MMVERKFSIKYVVKNCQKLRSTEYSQTEEYFGVPWRISIHKSNNQLGAYLCCMKFAGKTRPWSVDGSYKMCLLSTTGKEEHHKGESCFFSEELKLGWNNFRSWDDVVKNHMKNDSITIVCHVTIKKMDGLATEKKICFEKHEEHLSDMVLKVGGQKFNINKSLLAFRSPYFKALFFGKFTESKSAEVELKDVDPEFFQNLLDAIYGESSVVQGLKNGCLHLMHIPAENVEGLLELTDQFDVKLVRDKCEKFLMHTDAIGKRTRLRLADKYELEKLKSDCLHSMGSMGEIKACTPSDVIALNHSTLAALFEICLELH